MKFIMKYRMVLASVLILAAVGWAVGERADRYGGGYPVWFNKGLYVGSDAQNPASNVKNKVTALINCQCDEDFPNIANKYTEINPNPCACPGVKLGDPCTGGVLQASTTPDGGSSMTIGMELQVIARKNDFIEFDLTNQLGDGGAVNPFDAGYFGRCISSQ